MTNTTTKLSLALAVTLRAVTASAARPAGVAGVNGFNADAVLARHVRELQEERRERPAMLNQALLFSDSDSGANTFQVFHRNHARVNPDGFADNAVSHVPEQPLYRALLSARQPFEESPLIATLLPCGLKRTTLPESLLANVPDLAATENFASRCGRHAHDARINAENFRPVRIRHVFGADQVQIPDLAFARNGRGRQDFPTAVKVARVIVRQNQARPDSSLERGQRSASLLKPDRQRARVVAHGRRWLPFVTATALALAGFGDDVAGRADEVGGQPCQLPHVFVSDVMECDGVEDFLLKSNSRSVIERDRVSRLSVGQSRRCVGRHFQLNFQRDSCFHISELCHVADSNTSVFIALHARPFSCGQLKQTVSNGLIYEVWL